VSGSPIRRGSWQPHNFDGSVGHGNVPLKTALAKSYNVAAVHLLDMIGIQTGAQMVRRFGITQPMAPYLPSALGATEVPLDQMVSAYSAFPNKGVRVEDHLIRNVLDRDGVVLEEWEKTTYKVTSEYVALTMVELMRGVVTGGTAKAASGVGVPVAGKTGTVNDHTDVWFIGYTPTYVTGVWMGYPDRKKNLGRDMTGGQGALPIWLNFMKDFLKDKEKENFEKAPKMPETSRNSTSNASAKWPNNAPPKSHRRVCGAATNAARFPPPSANPNLSRSRCRRLPERQASPMPRPTTHRSALNPSFPLATMIHRRRPPLRHPSPRSGNEEEG
jgi:penicillin-binding protein 1A